MSGSRMVALPLSLLVLCVRAGARNGSLLHYSFDEGAGPIAGGGLRCRTRRLLAKRGLEGHRHCP